MKLTKEEQGLRDGAGFTTNMILFRRAERRILRKLKDRARLTSLRVKDIKLSDDPEIIADVTLDDGTVLFVKRLSRHSKKNV